MKAVIRKRYSRDFKDQAWRWLGFTDPCERWLPRSPAICKENAQLLLENDIFKTPLSSSALNLRVNTRNNSPNRFSTSRQHPSDLQALDCCAAASSILREATASQIRDRHVATLSEQIFKCHRRCYGYWRIHKNCVIMESPALMPGCAVSCAIQSKNYLPRTSWLSSLCQPKTQSSVGRGHHLNPHRYDIPSFLG